MSEHISEQKDIDMLTFKLFCQPGRGLRQAFPGVEPIAEQMAQNYIAATAGDEHSPEAQKRLDAQLALMGLTQPEFDGWMDLMFERTQKK